MSRQDWANIAFTLIFNAELVTAVEIQPNQLNGMRLSLRRLKPNQTKIINVMLFLLHFRSAKAYTELQLTFTLLYEQLTLLEDSFVKHGHSDENDLSPQLLHITQSIVTKVKDVVAKHQWALDKPIHTVSLGSTTLSDAYMLLVRRILALGHCIGKDQEIIKILTQKC